MTLKKSGTQEMKLVDLFVLAKGADGVDPDRTQWFCCASFQVASSQNKACDWCSTTTG